MASIGVKFNQSSVGTDLADTLAKAFLGDPKTDMDYARLISTIKTDEVQRRNYEQDILYRKALEQKALDEVTRAQADAAADAASVPYFTKLGVDAQGNPITKTGTPTEPPVVVMPSTFPARPAPTPLPMPGGPQIPAEYPTSTFPARPAPTALPMPAAVEPPIPVEYPPSTFPARPAPTPLPMPPAAAPPEMISAFPVRPEGQARPLPPNVTAQLYAPEPGSLSGPPASPPVDAPPAGSAAPAGGSLWDVFASALGIEPPPAQATLPPANVVEPVPNRGARGDRLPLPSERPLYDQPIPANMIQATPDRSSIRIPGPLPTVEAPLAVPPQPQPQPSPVDIKIPGALPTVEAPLPIEQPPPAATTPAEVAAKPALPTVEAPVKPPPLPIQGTNAGKADTPATVETKIGPMPREGVEAMVKAIMTGEGTPESKMQAVQRLMGTLGTTYNPDYGKDPRVTENLGSLRQGGAAISKDSQAANLTAEPALPGTAPGTGQDAWITNTFLGVEDAIRQGKAPPASVADAYAQAYSEASKPRIEFRQDAETGQSIPVTVPGHVDPALPSPAAVRAWANGTGPKPTVGATATAPTTTTAPAESTTAAPAESTAAAPATTTETGPVVATGAPIGGKKSQPLTKEQADNQGYYENTKAADAELRAIKNLPSLYESTVTDPVTGGSTDLLSRLLTGSLDASARKKNPDIDRYWGAATSFASAILRKESGAATRPEDMKTIMERYIPDYSDTPDVIKTKELRREIAMDALARGTFKVKDENQRLAEVDKFVDQKIAEMKGVRDDTAAPAAPATSGEIARPSNVPQEEWDNMTPEDKALFKS